MGIYPSLDMDRFQVSDGKVLIDGAGKPLDAIPIPNVGEFGLMLLAPVEELLAHFEDAMSGNFSDNRGRSFLLAIGHDAVELG